MKESEVLGFTESSKTYLTGSIIKYTLSVLFKLKSELLVLTEKTKTYPSLSSTPCPSCCRRSPRS